MGIDSVDNVPPPVSNYEDQVQKPEPEKPEDNSTDQENDSSVQPAVPNDDTGSTIKQIAPQDDEEGNSVDLLA